MKLHHIVIPAIALGTLGLTACDNKNVYSMDKVRQKYRNERYLTEAFKLDQQEFAFQREFRYIPEATVTRQNNTITVKIPTQYTFRTQSEQLRKTGTNFMTRFARVVTHFKNANVTITTPGNTQLAKKRVQTVSEFLTNKRFEGAHLTTQTSTQAKNITFTIKNANG